jgi:hypothetical protein
MQKSPSRKSDLITALKMYVKKSSMTSLEVLPKGLFSKLDWTKPCSSARRSSRRKTDPTENELTPIYHDPTARSDSLDPTARDGRAANHIPVNPPLSQRLRSATEVTPDVPITNKKLAGLHDEDYFMGQTVIQFTFSDSIDTDNEDDDPGRAVSDHITRSDPPDELDKPSRSSIHNSAVPSFFHSRANMEQKSRLTIVRPASTRTKSTSDNSMSEIRRLRARLTSGTSVSKAH